MTPRRNISCTDFDEMSLHTTLTWWQVTFVNQICFRSSYCNIIHIFFTILLLARLYKKKTVVSNRFTHEQNIFTEHLNTIATDTLPW